MTSRERAEALSGRCTCGGNVSTITVDRRCFTCRLERALDAHAAEAVAAERERCARVAENELSVDAGDPARWTDELVAGIAATIRRGEAG